MVRAKPRRGKPAKPAPRAAPVDRTWADVVEATLDAVIMMDANGHITAWNAQAARTFGWSAEEVLGRAVADTIVPPAYRADHLRALAHLRATGEGPILRKRLELSALHKDGHEFLVELTVTPLRPGRRGPFCAFIRDITADVGAKRALAESEASYRTLVDHAAFGIFRATPDDRFLNVNPALVRMLGYDTERELLALNIARDVFADRAERDRVLALRATGEATIEAAWKRKDGRRLTVRLTGRVVRNADGSVAYTEVFAEDVTGQHEYEARQRQSQRLEAIGRLAGGVAHDFNNLLTAILSSAELLGSALPTDHPARTDADEIRAAALRAADLTRQLLAFSRRQVFQPRVIDLNAVVTRLEKLLRRLIGEHVELRTTLAPDLPAVRADPGQIEQVITNLVVNARDAMPQGGTLSIRTSGVALGEGHTAEFSIVTPGSYVELAVTDTGQGMDAETQSHLFEPFFTTKAKGSGTGLGLATIYGIVKQSGGHIFVESQPGRGATFRVCLPAVDERPEGEPVRPAALTGGSETILLVEDEEAVRRLSQRILAKHGYTILEAGGGTDALALAAAHSGPIHLLATDVVMPGMSGAELARRMVVERPGLRVLFVSGYTDDEIAHHGVLDPDVALVEKPFTPDELARRVREILDRPSAADRSTT